MRFQEIMVPFSSVPVVFNLYVSIPTMCATWLIVQMLDKLNSSVSIFTMVLCTSVIVHNLLLRQFQNSDFEKFSERVGRGWFAQKLQDRFGNFLTFHLIINMNTLLALSLISCVAWFVPDRFNTLTLFSLFLILKYMVDPILALFLQIKSNLLESLGTVLVSTIAYMAVILLAVGAIPASQISADLYPYVVCFGLISARLAFLTNFAFDKKQDLVVFAPSIMAILVAVLPNFTLILQEF